MIDQSLKLLLHIPKKFEAFEVLKLFLLLLEVTCVIWARATNTDVWQAVVARATKSRVVSHLKTNVSSQDPSPPPLGVPMDFHGVEYFLEVLHNKFDGIKIK